MTGRKTILFVAENVTTAQVVRLGVLARALNPEEHDVVFACDGFDELLFRNARFALRRIHTLARERVFRAVAAGKPYHDLRSLRGYVEEELALMEDVRPDLVVGDLRPSLATSAPLLGVPYANLINAYWSPYAVRPRFPVPDHPVVRMLGLELAERYFPRALPRVFQHFARPFNEVRRRHGLSSIGDLLDVLTFGDFTLFPDVPELTPTSATQHPGYVYLGPVLWSPDVALPEWWRDLPEERPVVYATLGSSGELDALPHVVAALAQLPVTAIVATAGRTRLPALPPNVRAVDFIRGDVAARRAQVVISNGGSTTGYQALAEGTPVVGIASNLDQYLAMTAIEHAGAGILVRGGSASPSVIRTAVEAVLDSDAYHFAATRMAQVFGRWDATQRFRTFVAQATSTVRRTRATPPRTVHDVA